jgi:hypothetical protein
MNPDESGIAILQPQKPQAIASQAKTALGAATRAFFLFCAVDGGLPSWRNAPLMGNRGACKGGGGREARLNLHQFDLLPKFGH